VGCQRRAAREILGASNQFPAKRKATVELETLR